MRSLLRIQLVLLVLLIACAAGRSPGLSVQPAGPYRILVTNDDGVQAAGIAALATGLQALGEVTIAAPDVNQTGKGHAISITDPIYADTVTLPGGLSGLALTATPASCVKVALASRGVMAQRPNLVVSGINRGYNLGMVAYVSGTVGAAREAALQGIPAIASSLAVEAHPDYGPAVEATVKLAALVKARGLGPGVFFNVNVPPGPPKGMRFTTQSALSGSERYEERKNPRGRRYFWNSYEDPTIDVEGTDVWATSQGFVAVTPLKVGEFDERAFEEWRNLK
jgi:5'-nucleotidase